MSATGKDELICDFAETYHVFDWRGLPIDLAATLAAGLPESSRIKRKMRGDRATTEQILLARICDLLVDWIWSHAEGGERPASLVQMLNEPPKEPEKPKHKVFRSKAAFMKALSKFIEGGKNDG